jgi:hypothetical protein
MPKVARDAEASNGNTTGAAGGLGFWAAVREVFPQTREQRCWFHKIANVLNALPKSAQPGAKAAIAGPLANGQRATRIRR